VKPSSNIILIGMPGSGKSTVGVILAKQCCKAFLDTDVLIQTRTGTTLQDIVDRDGYLALRALEEMVLLDLHAKDAVIATGGSAVYSERAMKHLKADGIVVFLDANLPTLRSRVSDFGSRGLAKRPDQSFEELFSERRPLYQRYADVTIDCADLNHEEVSAKIIAHCPRTKKNGKRCWRSG
jgi:shikimate kinase